MKKLFGTDGVRGIANLELTPELAFKLGQAGAEFLAKGKKQSIIVGKDTRLSCDLLEHALISGICSMGVDVLRAGVIPTPGVSFLTRSLKAAGGVVISASHNPAEFNGIKFFDSQGYKLSDQSEEEIEKIMEEDFKERPSGEKIGRVKEIDDALERYINFLVGTISGDLYGFNIALDCANGATYLASPLVFRQLGARVLPVYVNPNGLNINQDCGSTHPETIREVVLTHDVDIGLSHDGDGDRVIIVDETGEIIDGDYILAITSIYLKNLGRLRNNTIVATVMSNLGLDLAMNNFNIKVARTKVGDRYVLEKMLEEGAILGGEQSGHIIFLEHNTTGDGIITALQLLTVMRDTRMKLSELKKVLKPLPQVLINVEVKKKELLNECKSIWKEVEANQKKLGDKGRILVRPSGTEPLVRVMVEAEGEKRANSIAQKIADIIEKELN